MERHYWRAIRLEFPLIRNLETVVGHQIEIRIDQQTATKPIFLESFGLNLVNSLLKPGLFSLWTDLLTDWITPWWYQWIWKAWNMVLSRKWCCGDLCGYIGIRIYTWRLNRYFQTLHLYLIQTAVFAESRPVVDSSDSDCTKKLSNRRTPAGNLPLKSQPDHVSASATNILNISTIIECY